MAEDVKNVGSFYTEQNSATRDKSLDLNALIQQTKETNVAIDNSPKTKL